MPDTVLNRENLREHIRKHLAIYLVAIAVALFAANFLWLVTTPRIPDDQEVLIYLAGPYSNAELLDDVAADLLKRGQEVDPSLRSVEFQGLLFADPEQDYTGVMLLMTRLATGEGDAFLADENAMNALVKSKACLPLDGYVNAGWLAQYGFTPRYDTFEDEETGETTTQMTGLRIDSLTALRDREAFENQGACLAVVANGRNLETTMKVLEFMAEDLVKAGETP